MTSLPGPGFFVGSDTDPTKITSGYEYDIAKAMQQAFGLSKLVVRNENFDAITAGTVTEVRRRVVADLHHLRPGQGREVLDPLLPVEPGHPRSTRRHFDPHARRREEGAVGRADQHDRQSTCSTKIKPDKEPKVFQQLPDAYAALQAKQIDAVLIDTAINLGEAARSNGKFEVVSAVRADGGPDQYGAILPKDSTNAPAINAVDQATRRLRPAVGACQERPDRRPRHPARHHRPLSPGP